MQQHQRLHYLKQHFYAITGGLPESFIQRFEGHLVYVEFLMTHKPEVVDEYLGHLEGDIRMFEEYLLEGTDDDEDEYPE